jgi:hypothetical protein
VSIRPISFLVFLATVSCAAPAGAGPCPVNTFFHSGIVEPIDAAAFDTTMGTAQGFPNRDAFDLVAGTLHVYHPGSLSYTLVDVSDLFDVEGIPPGTIVPVTIEAQAWGWIATDGCGGTGCYGYVALRLTTPTDAGQGEANFNLFGPESRPFSYVVTSQAVFQAGSPILVSVALQAGRAPGGSHYAMGDASYRFVGLPAGARVVSCRGYADPGTPALPRSWGSLKARYR